MALTAHVGSFNTTTNAATNTVAVTGVGFTPKIAFFWWDGRTDTSDASGRASHNRGFGCAISTTDRRFMSSFSQDAQAAAVTNKTQGNAHCVGNTTSADAIDGLLDFVSWDADGFTLVIDDAFSTDMRVHYLVLGGTDLSNVVGGNFQKAASTTGDASVTGLAFQPDCVLLFTCNNNTIGNQVGVDSGFYLGLALSNTNQAHLAGGSNDGATTMQTVSYLNDAEFMTTMVAGINNIDSHATFVSMNSDGFTLNWSESNAQTVNFNYICLKGCQFALGTALTQTDTSTPIEVATSFTPVAGMVFSHNKAEDSVDALGNDDQTSIGAFSSTSARAAMAIADDDNVADSVVTTAVEHDAVYININAATGAVQGLMDVQTIDSGGVDFIMDDADPSQAMFIYWLFGAVGGTTYNATLSGSLTPAGALLKTTTHLLAGTVTPAGTLANTTQKVLAGTVEPTGAIAKTANKVATGTLTPTGELDDTITKPLGGTLTPVGTLTKQTAKTFAGALDPAGDLINTKVALLFVSGSLTPTGALLKTTTHLLTGALTPTGDLAKQTSKPLSGSVTPTGTLARAIGKTFAGTLTPAGDISKQTGKGLTGSLTPSGSENNTTQKPFAGSLTPTGAIAFTAQKIFSGSLTPTGALTNTKVTLLSLTGSITPAGALSKQTSKPLSGGLLPIGALTKQTAKTFSGTLGLAGTLVATINLIFTPPANRTYSVPYEDRTYSVPAEDRMYSVPSGDE